MKDIPFPFFKRIRQYILQMLDLYCSDKNQKTRKKHAKNNVFLMLEKQLNV
jgi:hypothetical protein